MKSLGNRLSAEALKKQFKLTDELAGSTSVGHTIREIEETTGADGVEWLLDLPRYKFKAGMINEALGHLKFWAGIVERADFLGDGVQTVSISAERDEPHDQIDELDLGCWNDVSVQIKPGMRKLKRERHV